MSCIGILKTKQFSHVSWYFLSRGSRIFDIWLGKQCCVCSLKSDERPTMLGRRWVTLPFNVGFRVSFEVEH